MRLSRYFLPLLRDDPKEAEIVSHRLMLRAGMLRQQSAYGDARPNRSLADYVAPKGRKPDYVGAFAVTTGHGAPELTAAFKARGDDYNAIMVKAIADRLAEAFAEWLHRKVRRELAGPELAIVFGPPEYAALMLLGLSLVMILAGALTLRGRRRDS